MNRLTAPGVFVAGVWLAMTLAAGAFVVQFTSPFFYQDEWDLVPGLVGQDPLPHWLWAQHNEHRLPLPKLVHYALMHASAFDARAGSFATIAVLSLLSLSFIAAARRIRGRVDFADAFFPIALLNWGHFENYLIGFQIGFALSLTLACLWLTGSIQTTMPWWTWFALPLLALCGAHGIVYVPPLGLVTLWLTRHDTLLRRALAWGMTLLAFAIVGLYFVGYAKPTQHPTSAGITPTLEVALEVLSLGWGWVAQMTWPLSGIFTLAFIALTLIRLCLPSPGSAGEGPGVRAASRLPFLAVGAGTIALALGIGWGRSGFGTFAGFADRYAHIAFPIIGASYLAWLSFGRKLFSELVPMCMFVGVCLMLTQHVRTGADEGRRNIARMQPFANDLYAGKAMDIITNNHPAVYPLPNVLADRLKLLSDAGIARYHTPKPH